MGKRLINIGKIYVLDNIKNHIFLNFIMAVILIMVLFLSGCVTYKKQVKRLVRSMEHVNRVAILPFENISGQPDAGKKTTNIFMARLCQTGLFDVVEMGLVDQVLLEERVRLTGQLDQATLLNIGRKLKVDAVIMEIGRASCRERV